MGPAFGNLAIPEGGKPRFFPPCEWVIASRRYHGKSNGDRKSEGWRRQKHNGG